MAPLCDYNAYFYIHTYLVGTLKSVAGSGKAGD